MIWYWIKGSIKIYTKRVELAMMARREGNHVVILNDKPHIFGINQ